MFVAGLIVGQNDSARTATGSRFANVFGEREPQSIGLSALSQLIEVHKTCTLDSGNLVTDQQFKLMSQQSSGFILPCACFSHRTRKKKLPAPRNRTLVFPKLLAAPRIRERLHLLKSGVPSTLKSLLARASSRCASSDGGDRSTRQRRL
jgi:hypothetical protein